MQRSSDVDVRFNIVNSEILRKSGADRTGSQHGLSRVTATRLATSDKTWIDVTHWNAGKAGCVAKAETIQALKGSGLAPPDVKGADESGATPLSTATVTVDHWAKRSPAEGHGHLCAPLFATLGAWGRSSG